MPILTATSQRLLVLDSNALMHRARSAFQKGSSRELTTSSGLIVTGTYVFLNNLFSVIREYDITSVVATYDAGGNWRKKENADYKANRQKERTPLHTELDLLTSTILPQLGISAVGAYGYEADDAIATISRETPATWENIIFSCDKDLLQLVNHRTKVLLFSSQKKIEMVDVEGVQGHFGVFPSEVAFYKAMVGDKSDNIEGLKGIGPKKGAKIITEARGDNQLDRILLSLPFGQDEFRENLRLVTLENDVPNLTWFASSVPAEEQVRGILTALEFNSLLKPKRFAEILDALSRIGGLHPEPAG